MTVNNDLLHLLPLIASADGGLRHTITQILAPPPLHPILVHFTAALVPVSFLFDLAARWQGAASVRAAAAWTLFAAAAATPFVALSGWLWLSQMEDMSHGYMLIHQWLGTVLAALIIPLAIWRIRYFRRDVHPGNAYFVTFLLFVVAVTLQGHIGGMMTFGAASDAETPDVSGHDQSVSTQPDDGWKDHLELKD